jgi:hypothetical protein
MIELAIQMGQSVQYEHLLPCLFLGTLLDLGFNAFFTCEWFRNDVGSSRSVVGGFSMFQAMVDFFHDLVEYSQSFFITPDSVMIQRVNTFFSIISGV